MRSEPTSKRVSAVLTICRHCLDRLAPQSGWPARLRALFDEYPAISRPALGFPANWADCPVWKEVGDAG